jgi:hypothetical protein
MTVRSNLVKVFHFIAAVQFFFGIYYECIHVLPEERKLRKFTFGGKMIYLTFIDAVSSLKFYKNLSENRNFSRLFMLSTTQFHLSTTLLAQTKRNQKILRLSEKSEIMFSRHLRFLWA